MRKYHIYPINSISRRETRQNKKKIKKEIEFLENYAQVMKNTNKINKEDTEKFLSELKTLKLRLQDIELSLTAKIQEVIELEHKI